MLCDFHAQLFDESGYAEELTETAKNLGFDKLCIGGGEARFALASNAEVLRQAETYPELFIPFAFFRLGKDDAYVVEELHRRGFRGLRVSAPPAPYDASEFAEVYEAAEVLHMPVLFHTGLLPPTPLDRAFAGRSEWMRPICLDTLARLFPGLRIVGCGLGMPWCEEAAEVLAHHGNVFFDICVATLRKKDLQFFRSLLGGPSNVVLEEQPSRTLWTKIVFGSGVRHEEIASVERNYQRLFRSLALPQEVIEAIMGGTAARLLGISGGTSQD